MSDVKYSNPDLDPSGDNYSDQPEEGKDYYADPLNDDTGLQAFYSLESSPAVTPKSDPFAMLGDQDLEEVLDGEGEEEVEDSPLVDKEEFEGIEIEIDEPTSDGDPDQELDEFGLSGDFENDPYNQQTETKLSENGWLRIGVIGFGAILGLGLIGLIISNVDLQAMVTHSQEKAQLANRKEEEKPRPPEDPKITTDRKMGAIALADQDVATATADQALRAKELGRELGLNEQSNSQKVTNAAKRNQSVRPTTPSLNTRPNPTPSGVFVPRSKPTVPITRPPQRVSYRPPAPWVNRPPAPVGNPRSVAPAPKPEIDPYTLYAQITETGSFGGANHAGDGQQQSRNPVGQTFFHQNSQNLGELLMNPNEVISAQLESPMVWGGSSAIKKGLAVVTEGNESIPTGTLLAVVSNSESSGRSAFVDLQITHAYIDGESRAINGQTQIMKSNGKPLEAKRKGGRSGSIFPTIGKALLGAVSNGTSLLNRADSVVTTSGSFSSSVQTNGDQNFILGALEGVSDTLLDDLKARNQAAIDRQNGGEYYLVPAGQTLQIRALEEIKG